MSVMIEVSKLGLHVFFTAMTMRTDPGCGDRCAGLIPEKLV